MTYHITYHQRKYAKYYTRIPDIRLNKKERRSPMALSENVG